MPYRDPKDPRIAENRAKFNKTEKGFIVNRIASIFKPSAMERRGLYPTCSKQDIWAELLLYVQKMKDKFPKTNGRICYYCFKPWTYIAHANNGKDRENTNFSIDRLDNSITYTKENLVFCCHKCNDAKHSITFELVDRIQEIREERKSKEDMGIWK
jgi:hypothetical protein